MTSQNFLKVGLSKKQVTTVMVAATAWVMLSSPARSQSVSHSYINDMRSSSVNHVFISNSVEAEYGPAKARYNSPSPGTHAVDSSATNSADQKETWRGSGFNTTLGMEVLKFVQFNAGHTFLNLRRNDSEFVRLSGSRMHAGARLLFTAPLANLEFGGGALASRYDYAYELTSSNAFGSGYYYSLGVNYYMDSRISFFANAKVINEHVTKNGGATELESLDLNTNNIGLGFTIWL